MSINRLVGRAATSNYRRASVANNKPKNVARPAKSPKTIVKPYGFELVLDLHSCDVRRFNRSSIDQFFTELCDLIDMEKCEVHFWDDIGVPPKERQTLPHTKGTSAVCFILTSSIVIHTLDLLGAAYVNIFSCKSFDAAVARQFTQDWFGAKNCRESFLTRL
jgi:S-adenosylmethionine/arginine decarboxylase-like enzyme